MRFGFLLSPAAGRLRWRAPQRGTAVLYVFRTLDVVLSIYVFLVLISAMLSWLVAFKLVRAEKSFSSALGDIVFWLTEPVLRRSGRFSQARPGWIFLR